MLIAGEASGDVLAAELVRALRNELTNAEVQYTADAQPLRTGLEPRFFGAGGPRMAAEGVELAFNLAEHSIIGIPSLNTYRQGRQRFNHLLQLAIERQPDVIVGIDYNYFNLKFAHAIREYVSRQSGWFHDWRPKLVKYISPQVWASRESRAFQIARDYDLLLSIFPFEKDWYARRVPKLNVEFVGHPMVDRFAEQQRELRAPESPKYPNKPAEIVLLPGSRKGELKRHLPVMLGALKLIRNKHSAIRAKMILPTQSLMDLAKGLVPTVDCDLQLGNLAQALSTTDIAISKTGTITMECAFSGVPTITLYKTSWATYELGKRIVKVKSLTMPNLLANEEVFPEFIQGDATPERISQAALELLQNETRRAQIKAQLTKIVASLGGPGASLRAARAITKLLEREGGVNIKERP